MKMREKGEKSRQKKECGVSPKDGEKGKRAGREERQERQEEGEWETKRDETRQKIFDKK